MTLLGLEVEETWICSDPVEAKPQALAVDSKRRGVCRASHASPVANMDLGVLYTTLQHGELLPSPDQALAKLCSKPPRANLSTKPQRTHSLADAICDSPSLKAEDVVLRNLVYRMLNCFGRIGCNASLGGLDANVSTYVITLKTVFARAHLVERGGERSPSRHFKPMCICVGAFSRITIQKSVSGL